jgi:hypothetical protein
LGQMSSDFASLDPVSGTSIWNHGSWLGLRNLPPPLDLNWEFADA